MTRWKQFIWILIITTTKYWTSHCNYAQWKALLAAI